MTIASVARAGIPLAIIAALLCAYLPILDNAPMVGGDQAYYILLGKSIASGNGYRALWDPANGAFVKYPFLYPLILSAVIWCRGYDFFLIRLVNVLFLVMMAIAFYFMIRRRTGPSVAGALAVLAGISPGLCLYVTRGLSEIPYLCFCLIAVVLTERYAAPDPEGKKRHALLAGAALAISAAFLTRIAGISLALMLAFAFLGERAARRRLLVPRRIVVLFVIASLVIAAWFLRCRLADTAGALHTYASELAMFPNPVFDEKGGVIYGRLLPLNIYGLIFYSIPYDITGIVFDRRSIAAFALTGIALIGFASSFKKYRGCAEYYTLAYTALMIAMPWTNLSRRYFVPMIPFLIFYFFEGMRLIYRRVRMGRVTGDRLGGALVVAVLLCGVSAFCVFVAEKGYRDADESLVGDYLAVTAWARRHIPADSILLSAGAGEAYLYSGRKAVGTPFVRASLPRFVRYLEEGRIGYYLASGLYSQDLTDTFFDLLRSYAGRLPHLTEVFRARSCALYLIEK